MKKQLTILITILLVILSLSKVMQVAAEVDLMTRESYGLDETLVKQEEMYELPDSIVIAPISLPAGEYTSDEDWYKGLYYYQTSRLNQGDFQFHYVVFRDGTVVKANQKGVEQKIFLENETRPIVIAYLSDSSSTDFAVKAKESLQSLVLELANKNSILLEEVYVKDIEYIAKENEFVIGRSGLLSGAYARSVNDIKRNLASQYTPQPKTYNLEVAKVALPTAPVNYGENVIVTITIKNNSDNTLFAGSDFEPLISMVGGDLSKFYVNGVWQSLTQAPLMSEGTVIKPNSSQDYQLRLSVPLYTGEQVEKFQLVNSLGQVYPNTSFEIKLNVAQTDKDIVEIAATETGWLNVRQNASGASNIVGRVSSGQRYIVIERSTTGWVKIDTGNDAIGWVAQQHTKKI